MQESWGALDGGIARDGLYANRCSTFVVVRYILAKPRRWQGVTLLALLVVSEASTPALVVREYWDGETFTNGWSCHYSVTSSHNRCGLGLLHLGGGRLL